MGTKAGRVDGDRCAGGGPGATGEAASRAHGQSGKGVEGASTQTPPQSHLHTEAPRPRGLAHTASLPPPRSTNQKPGTHSETPRAQAQHTLRASHTYPVHQRPTATDRASLHWGPGSPERHTQQLASQSLGPDSTPLGPCSVPFQPTGGSPSLMAGSGAAALSGAEGVGKTDLSRAEAPEVGPSLTTSRSTP